MSHKKHSPTKRHMPLIGIPIIIVACFFNAAMATTIKLIGTQAPSSIVIFMRFAFSLAIFVLLLLIFPRFRPIRKTLKINSYKPIFIRTVFGIVGFWAYFIALKKLPLSEAVVLAFTTPLFIPFCIKFFVKSKVAHRLWWGLVLGFIGVTIVVGAKFNHFNIGLILGLLTGFFAAITASASRISTYTDKPITINFYFFLVSTLISLIICINPLIELWTTFTPKLWLMFAIVGLCGCAYQGLLLVALYYSQAKIIGAFLYLTVVFATINGYLIFGRTPTLGSYIGSTLIILGGALTAILDPSKKKKKNETISQP